MSDVVTQLPTSASRCSSGVRGIKCDKHGTVYAECGPFHAASELTVASRTPEALVEWRRTAIHLARRYQALTALVGSVADIDRVRTEGIFNGSCRWCDVRTWCWLGRTEAYAASNLVREPWRPLEYARGAAMVTSAEDAS